MKLRLLAILAVGATVGSSMAEEPPAQIKLRSVEFKDVNMGNVVAYTMLVPEGWKAEGHIEWSNERTPYPQRKIEVIADDNSRIHFLPAMPFAYSEATQLAIDEAAAMGLPLLIPRQSGEPPPKKLGEWLMTHIPKVDKRPKNLKLVEDNRDKATEEAIAKQSRAAGNAATTIEIHTVKFTYELDGVPFTQEVNFTYFRNPTLETRNINMMSWMLFSNINVRAPSAKFDKVKPLLYASAQSLRSVPKWFTQSQMLIMEITRQNHAIGMEQIRQRGRFYDQISDDNFAAWKKSQAVGDAKQNDRINAINEVQDFRDANGLSVKLPIHYKHYYTDGKGNYLLSNATGVPPGSEWTILESAK